MIEIKKRGCAPLFFVLKSRIVTIHPIETTENKEIPHFVSLPARLRQSGGHYP